MKGILNGESLNHFKPNKGMGIYNNFCYVSLDEALKKIYDYEVNANKHPVTAHVDYDIVHRELGNNRYEPFTQRRDEILTKMR